MTEPAVLGGLVCARRNGINGVPGGIEPEGGNRSCRKFLASTFRHKPRLAPMINE